MAVPLVWYAGVVVPIFKKDNQRECFSYVGITLVSLPGKVQVRILVRRDIQLVKPQFQEEKFGGFCPRCRILDQVFIFSRIFEGTWELEELFSICFLDLEKAFY